MSALDVIIERKLSETLGVNLHVSMASCTLDRSNLSEKERIKFAEVESTPRAKSWLTGRAALKRVLSKLGRSLDTADITFPNPELSLSHSGDYAIAIFSDDIMVTGIGIDIELIRTVRPAAARFFLTEQEQDFVNDLPSAARADELLRLWTVKESVFKADMNNEKRGLKHYGLIDPSIMTGQARIAGNSRIAFKYSSLKLETAVVSGAVNMVIR